MIRKAMTLTTLVLIVLIASNRPVRAAVNGLFNKVDSVLGYTYNGTAPSGQVLCGNGTFFIPSSSCASTHVTGTLTDVTGSRAIGTTYTNSGTTAIQPTGTMTSNVGGDTSEVTCTVNGLKVWAQQANATVIGFHDSFNCGNVPPGGTYIVSTQGTTSFTLTSWIEFTY